VTKDGKCYPKCQNGKGIQIKSNCWGAPLINDYNFDCGLLFTKDSLVCDKIKNGMLSDTVANAAINAFNMTLLGAKCLKDQ
jgi:hypothetical protein